MLTTKKSSKSNSPFVIRVKRDKESAQYPIFNASASIGKNKAFSGARVKNFRNSQIVNANILEVKPSTVLLPFEL